PPTPDQIRLTALAASAAGDAGDAYFYMGEYQIAGGDLYLAAQQLQLALASPHISQIQRQRYLARLEEVREYLASMHKRQVASDTGDGQGQRGGHAPARAAQRGCYNAATFRGLRSRMRSNTYLSLLSVCLLLLYGCATLPPGVKRDPRDPGERMNRGTYKFNDPLDRAILKPVAKGYSHLPQPMQSGVHNFFDNLEYPVVIVNDLLQGQVRAFVSDIGRLVLNTGVGFGGLSDPASPAGLDKHDRDFGQTLGKWGVPKGPYIVVPLLGPYDVRDGIGAATVDTFANPRNYTNRWT